MPDFTAFPAVLVMMNMKFVPAVMKSAKIVWIYVMNVVGVSPVSMGKTSIVRVVTPADTPTPGYAEIVMRHVRNVTVLTVLTVICAANVSVRDIVRDAVSVKVIRICVAFATTVSSAARLVPKALPAVPA